MNKTDIIKALAQRNRELNYSQVKKLTDKLFLSLAQALSSGHRIEVRGFGAFSLKARSGIVRNPCHGVTFDAGKRHVVYFRVSRELAKRVDFKKIKWLSTKIVKTLTLAK
jgi:integration host factor subunit beta